MSDQSIWKKEISFRRKPKEPKEPKEPKVPAVLGEEPKSIWKKEISFSRKSKPEAAKASEQKPSIWKKEITLARKSKPVDATPEPAPEAAQRPVRDSGPVEGVRGNREVFPTTDSVPEHESEVVEQHEPVHEESWESEPEVPPEPIDVPAETVVADAPTEDVPAPATVAPAEQAVVHPPVPAAELPPLPEDREEKRTPLWRREVVFGRRGAAKPKAKARAAKTEEPKAEKREREEEPTPLWRREVVFGRRGVAKPKAEATAAKIEAEATAAKIEEPKAKEPKAEKPKRQKKLKAPKVKAPKVKAERGGKGKKLVGLKIGASQLAAARVTNNGAAELLQVAREPLSPGIVVGGELRDPDALASALKDFFNKHKLPKRGVRLGIANNRIGVRTFEIAGIEDQKQLDNAIRYRAQEALPIPIDEAVLDYQLLGEVTNEEGERTKRILLVVAYREQIDRYVDACKKAGVGLVGIDLEAFALLRALQAPQVGAGDDPSAALVAVAIGHERSTFAVSNGRVCEFTRVLEWGGGALNVAIARALDAAPSEVEAVKRALSLADETVPEGLTPEQTAKARDAVRRAIQAFARELVSSLQFYQNQPGSLGIGEIVLTGGTTHLPGLAGELERLIGVRVRVGDPLARMKVSKRLGEPEQIGSYAVAIGLGIED